jgi:hypothetical protein
MRCSCSDGWWAWMGAMWYRGVRASQQLYVSIQATLVYEVVCRCEQLSVSFLRARSLLYLDGCSSGYGLAGRAVVGELMRLMVRCVNELDGGMSWDGMAMQRFGSCTDNAVRLVSAEVDITWMAGL